MTTLPDKWLWTAAKLCEQAADLDPARCLTLALLALCVAERGLPPDYWEVLRACQGRGGHR